MRWSALLLAVMWLGGCAADAPNKNPEINITSHREGVEVAESEAVEFRARVVDGDDGYSELLVSWHLGDIMVCPPAAPDARGISRCVVVPGERDRFVLARARDSKGAEARARRSIHVRASLRPTDEVEASLDSVSGPGSEDEESLGLVPAPRIDPDTSAVPREGAPLETPADLAAPGGGGENRDRRSTDRLGETSPPKRSPAASRMKMAWDRLTGRAHPRAIPEEPESAPHQAGLANDDSRPRQEKPRLPGPKDLVWEDVREPGGNPLRDSLIGVAGGEDDPVGNGDATAFDADSRAERWSATHVEQTPSPNSHGLPTSSHWSESGGADISADEVSSSHSDSYPDTDSSGQVLDSAESTSVFSETKIILNGSGSGGDAGADWHGDILSSVDSLRSMSRVLEQFEVHVFPEKPGVSDDLRCSVIGPSGPSFGERFFYRCGWYKNGVDMDVEKLRIHSSLTSVGDVWRCVIRAHEGGDFGVVGSDSVSIEAADTDNDGIPDHEDRCPGRDDNIDRNNNRIPDGCERNVVYSYTGEAQTFVVPPNVRRISAECYGAQGWNVSHAGGWGGYSSGALQVTPDAKLYIYVGGRGRGVKGRRNPRGGGWNGGGHGQSNSPLGPYAGGGGGATDVRLIYAEDPLEPESLASRIIVAGGGGGETDNSEGTGRAGSFGGHGGGLIGEAGGRYMSFKGGAGGTETEGGEVGGGFGYGGSAEPWMVPWNGGGGGGWYGGGASSQHSGGGGGSSYVGGVLDGVAEQGKRRGDGSVTITWWDPKKR